MTMICKECGFKIIYVWDHDKEYVRPKCLRCEGGYPNYGKSTSPRRTDPPYWKTNQLERRMTVKSKDIIMPAMEQETANIVWRTIKQKIVRSTFIVQHADKYTEEAVNLCRTNIELLGKVETELKKRLKEV